MNRTAWQIAVFSAASALGGTYLFGGEWLRFFAFFGSWGTIGVVLVSLGFIWMTSNVLLLIRQTGIRSHRQFFIHLFGERMAPALSFVLTVLLLLYAGSLFQEQATATHAFLSIPTMVGILIPAALAFLFLRTRRSSLFNSVLATLAISLFLLGGLFALQHHVPLPPLTYQLNVTWLWHALFYLSLHALFLVSSFLPDDSDETNRLDFSTIYIGAILGGIIFLLVSLFGHFAILAHWHDAHSLQHPLLRIFSNLSVWLVYPYLLAALFQISFLASFLVRSICQPFLTTYQLRALPVQMLFLTLCVIFAFGGSLIPDFSFYVEIPLRLLGFTILFRLIQLAGSKRP